MNFVGSLIIKGFVGQALFSIIGIVVNAMLGIAIYRVSLQIVNGQRADIGAAFQYDRWGEWILFSIVYGLLVGIGFIFCLIPGLILLYFFALAPYFFLDQNMSLGEAFTASKDAVSAKGVGFPVLLCIIVGVLGLIVCFVGVLITAPLAYVAVGYLYKYSIGQPAAA